MSSGSPRLSSRGWRTRWIGAGLVAARRGLGFGALMVAGTGLLLALAAPLMLAGLALGQWLHRSGAPANAFTVAPGGIPQPAGRGELLTRHPFLMALVVLGGCVVWLLLLPRILAAIRLLARLTRLLAGDWCGVRIADPYLPAPAAARGSLVRRLRWMLADPATGRDVLWLAVNSCGGWILAVIPAGLMAVGLVEFIGPDTRPLVAIPPPAFPGNKPFVLLVLGAALIALGLGCAPALLAGYGRLARSLLGPAGQAELALRVRHLAETRSEAIDTGAAEMRRIERDLHDGAQARLVAMGMTLDAAGQLIESNPAAARALLLEARDTSARARAELRDLVRGIHPPVLADRGLGDAIRALAMDSPLRARLASDLPGRLPAPVESAAYFAVSELLANVSKHAGATQAWIDIRYGDGMLRVGVSDDGRGGADPSRGTGLRGIERRVAAFDGVVALSSPPGGPTAVTLEIPCALSSQKTSSY
ncbi:MAG: histidine kinase [Streptosporangiaceae bacterium]